MVDTPWLIGPIVPQCGMPGELVCLRNGPCCLAVPIVPKYSCCWVNLCTFVTVHARSYVG